MGKIKDMLDNLNDLDKLAREQRPYLEESGLVGLKLIALMHQTSSESRAELQLLKARFTLVYFKSPEDVSSYFENVRADRKIVEFGEAKNPSSGNQEYYIIYEVIPTVF